MSEFQRRPAGTATGLGEWVEWCHTSAVTYDLFGVRLSSSSNPAGWTLGARLLLTPGLYLVAADSGDPARNGGVLPHLVWPAGALTLADTSGSLTLQPGESVTYVAGFPGGNGVSAERRDLEAPPLPANWSAATVAYGAANRGTPGRPSLTDTTPRPPALAVAAPLPPGRRIRFTLYSPATVGSLHLIGLSGSTTPGIQLHGHRIPLNPDPLFSTGLLLPGLVGWVPADGLVGPALTVPAGPYLKGLRIHAAAVIIDPWSGPVVQATSTAVTFVLP